MTEETLPLAELLAKAGDGDFLRSVAEAVVQLLMETDVEGLIGAGRHERSGDRTTYRNGYRDRTLDTRLGALQLRIPKLRQGSYFPPFLEPRKTSEKALVAVIQEAWVNGVSTRRVDDLVQAMGQGSARAPSASCARTSTIVSVPFSIALLSASGRIFGSTPPTSSSAKGAASSRSPR
jgi:transposase-like protein